MTCRWKVIQVMCNPVNLFSVFGFPWFLHSNRTSESV